MFRQLETSLSVWESLDSSSNFALFVDLFGSLAGIEALDFAGRDILPHLISRRPRRVGAMYAGVCHG